jgi:hypothetical protein
MVKVGFRKPSIKKSISARTKGRATRAVKKAIIPGYGQKGMGWAHPKKKLYNTVYNKTTIDTRKVIIDALSANKNKKESNKTTKIAPIIQGDFKTHNDTEKEIVKSGTNSSSQQKPATSTITFAHLGRVIREMCGWSFWLCVLFSLINAGTFFLFMWVILWLVTWTGIIDKK